MYTSFLFGGKETENKHEKRNKLQGLAKGLWLLAMYSKDCIPIEHTVKKAIARMDWLKKKNHSHWILCIYTKKKIKSVQKTFATTLWFTTLHICKCYSLFTHDYTTLLPNNYLPKLKKITNQNSVHKSCCSSFTSYESYFQSNESNAP